MSCGLDDNNFRFFVSGSPELKIAGDFKKCTTKVSGEFGASKVTEAFDSFEAVWAALRRKVP